MDLGTEISLNVVISVISGIGCAVGAYVKLKSRIDVLEVENVNQEKEIDDLRERKKDMSIQVNRRVDAVELKVQELSKEITVTGSNLEKKMSEMELRIIKEIQNIRK